MNRVKKKITKIAIGVLMCIALLGVNERGIVYAKASISYEEEMQQREVETLQTAMAVTTDENREVEEIDGCEIKANIMERALEEPLNDMIQFNGSQSKARTVMQNTDPNYAYLVSNDVVMQGTLENENEFRWYAFTLEEKNKVSILLQMVTDLDADLYMFVLNQETYDLELVGGSAVESLGAQEFYSDVLEQGTYYFAVAGYEGTGDFAFAYYQSSTDVGNEINDYVDVATEVAMNADIVGVIDNPNDYDYYKFTVSEPTILRYNIVSTDGYALGYAGSSGSTPIIIEDTMIKVEEGTYYFAVYSPTGSYSVESTYSVNFKRIGEYADESVVPLRAIREDASIVFQTNVSGTSYYVNGNPIDINYEYHYEDSNPYGSQSYNITLSDTEETFCQIWDEEVQGPDVIYYSSSTHPNIHLEKKYLLRLMFFADYEIDCRGTGAYLENTVSAQPGYVIVLIDPDTGKLVDIAEPNFFYDYSMSRNTSGITASSGMDMVFNYSIYDYID